MVVHHVPRRGKKKYQPLLHPRNLPKNLPNKPRTQRMTSMTKNPTTMMRSSPENLIQKAKSRSQTVRMTGEWTRTGEKPTKNPSQTPKAKRKRRKTIGDRFCSGAQGEMTRIWKVFRPWMIILLPRSRTSSTKCCRRARRTEACLPRLV